MLARRLAQPLRRVGARTSATDGRAAAQATLDSPGRQRLVVALGGNALLKRGQPLTFANQMAAAKEAAPKLVELSKKHLVLSCAPPAWCYRVFWGSMGLPRDQPQRPHLL